MGRNKTGEPKAGVQIKVRVTDELLSDLKKLAVKEGNPVTKVMADAAKAYVKTYKEEREHKEIEKKAKKAQSKGIEPMSFDAFKPFENVFAPFGADKAKPSSLLDSSAFQKPSVISAMIPDKRKSPVSQTPSPHVTAVNIEKLAIKYLDRIITAETDKEQKQRTKQVLETIVELEIEDEEKQRLVELLDEKLEEHKELLKLDLPEIPQEDDDDD